MKADTPIVLADLTKMTPDERSDHLDGIRTRRLAPVKAYEELSLMQAQARKEGLEEQWSKQLKMFETELKRADKALEKLEARHRKLRSMELEIEQL